MKLSDLEAGKLAHTQYLTVRNRAIVTLYLDGWSLRRIGGCFGLSHEQVRRIVTYR